jgi:hypothetical protein
VELKKLRLEMVCFAFFYHTVLLLYRYLLCLGILHSEILSRTILLPEMEGTNPYINIPKYVQLQVYAFFSTKDSNTTY